MRNPDSGLPNDEIERTAARLEKDIKKAVQIEEATTRVEEQIEQASDRVS